MYDVYIVSTKKNDKTMKKATDKLYAEGDVAEYISVGGKAVNDITGGGLSSLILATKGVANQPTYNNTYVTNEAEQGKGKTQTVVIVVSVLVVAVLAFVLFRKK